MSKQHPLNLASITRLAATLIAALTLAACSSAPMVDGDKPDDAYFDTSKLVHVDEHYADSEANDPWIGFNRSMYAFNYRVDRYFLLPIVSGYQFITPDFMETGIHNFFQNIGEIPTLYNSILQGGFTKSYQTTGRFLTNTTVGLLGLVDAATYIGIPKHKEDFGQTMGVWGVGSGPYLVLPVFGPSTVRDGFGLAVDTVAMGALREELDLSWQWNTVWTVLQAIDARASVDFRYYETGSPFEYEMIRTLWTTKRQLDIEK